MILEYTIHRCPLMNQDDRRVKLTGPRAKGAYKIISSMLGEPIPENYVGHLVKPGITVTRFSRIPYYTSEDVLAVEDLFEIADLASSGIRFMYKMTVGEIGWLEHVKGRYMIADVLEGMMESRYGELVFEDIDLVNRALEADARGMGKAVMLSDDTALQRIFFNLYQEQPEDDDE